MKIKKIRKRYWILIAFTVLLAVGAILPIRQLINNYTDQVVRSKLNDALFSSSKEPYTLDYDKLRFNIFRQRITLSNFRISPIDTAKFNLQKSDSIPSFVQLNIETVELNLEQQLEIFLSNQLFIKSLNIKSPKVRLHQNKQNQQKIKFAQISGDIYKTVTQYLSQLRLDAFSVSNAEVDFSLDQGKTTDRYQFEPFSFTIKNFRVKEGKQNNKMFFTDDLEFNSGNQRFLLPDSSHQVSFDRFKISTTKNQIEFYNLRVNPLKNDSAKNNQITLFIPALKLNSVDFERAYTQNEYAVKKLIIDRPAIKFFVNKSDTTNRAKKMAELEKWLNQISINATRISKGNFAVIDNRTASKKTYLLNSLSLKLQGLQVDTSILDKVVLRKLQNNYRLTIREVKHQIPEEELLIKAKDIEYSSITKDFSCSAVNITPNDYKQQQQLKRPSVPVQLKNLQVEKVAIANLDLNAIDEGSKTELAEIVIKTPTMNLAFDTLFHQTPDSVKGKRKALPYSFDSLSVKVFKMQNAGVFFTNSRNPQTEYGSVKNTHVELVNIAWADLNQQKLDWINLLKKGRVISRNADFTNPISKSTIRWNTLDAHPSRKSLLLSGFSHIPAKKDEPKISLGNAELQGFEYDLLLANRELVADKLMLANADIKWHEKPKSGDTNALKKIDISNLSAKNINLKKMRRDSAVLQINEAAVNASNLRFNSSDSSDKTLTYNTLSASSKAITSVNKSNKVATTIESFSFNSSDSTLSLYNIKVNPVIQNVNRETDAVFQQKVAYISLFGFSPDAQNVGKNITANHVEICSPTTYLSLLKNQDKKPNQNTPDLKKLHKRLLDSLNALSIQYNTLAVDNGRLNVIWKDSVDSKDENRLIVNQYTVESTGFKMNETSKNTDDNLLYAKDYNINLYNVKCEFPDSLNDLIVKHINYSTEQKNLKLSGLKGSYMVQTNGEKKLFVEGTVGMVEFDGVKPFQITDGKTLSMKGIYAINPRLEFTQFHNKQEVVSRELSLSNSFSEDSSSITKTILNSLRIKDGFINWRFDNDSIQPIVVKHLNLEGEGIEYPNPDEGITKPKLTDLAFSFGDFEYDVMKDFYRFKFDSINYDSKEEALILDKVRLDPRYGIFEFGQQAGWQKSRLELYLNRVSLTGFKGKELLYENKLNISLLDIDSMWVRNFKDKRLPAPTRYIPMPQERLDSLDMAFRLKKVVLHKGEITHIQIAENGVVPGKIYFSDVSARASNIINDFGDQKAPERTRLNALGKLMGNGQLSASFEFNNQEPNGLFEGHASMGEFDARTLNNYLTHTAFVGVKSGNVLNAGVDFKAYNDFGAGDMRLQYNVLHVEFLNKEDTANKGLGVALKQMIANGVVFNKNPRFFRTKKGLVCAERDTTKEIFHYWSKLAMSGVASSTGVKNNKKELKKVRKELLRREKAILRDEEKFLKKSDDQSDQPYGGKGD